MNDKLVIRVQNRSEGPLTFCVWMYTRVESVIRGSNGRGIPKLEKVSEIADTVSTDPGGIAVFELSWVWDVPPGRIHWKAPPEQSCKWAVLEWSFKGIELVKKPTDGSLPVLG